MIHNRLIKDTGLFEEALKLAKRAFNYENRFPEQVFKVPFQQKYVFEFDKAMSYSFWNELDRLVTLSDDSYILMAVLDPHPVDYFHKEFSQYNWCIFPKGTTTYEYWDTLEKGPIESPADAIVFNSEVVVWFSPSMKWAIWGERSYGICILGLSEEIRSYTSEYCLTMEAALTDLVSLNFGNKIPDEVTTKLISHYQFGKGKMRGEMNREEAIAVILKSAIEDLSKEEREGILMDWWGIDQDGPEFEKLPEILQSEMLQFDEPQRDAMDEVYNALLFAALRIKYLGVRNAYLSKKVSAILHSDLEVEGLQEELYSCPCCEFKTLPSKGEYDICPVCFWEDDGSRDPNYYSSSNHMTLAQARDNFIELGAVDESSLRFLTPDRLELYSK